MIRLACLVSALGLTATFIAACGGDDTTAAPGGPIPIEKAYDEITTASCEKRVRCGQSEDMTTCMEYDAGAEWPELFQLVTDVSTSTVQYDTNAARNCADTLRRAACELFESVADEAKAACGPVFVGTRKLDESCYVTGECAGGNVCTGCAADAGCSCTGKCTAPPPTAALGEDCATLPCAEDSWCETAMDMTLSCVAELGNGNDCGGNEQCVDGTRCDVGGDDKCYTLAKQGQPCNPTLAQGSCGTFGNQCNPPAKKCVLRAKIGESCATVSCLDFGVCDGVTCLAKIKNGEACTDGGLACRSGVPCMGGFCDSGPGQQACN